MTFDYTFLAQPYHRDHWKSLLRHLFPGEADFFAEKTDYPEQVNERIESFVQFGNIELNDYQSLALFEVRLKSGTTKIQLNRVALRAIVQKMRDRTVITGAFAVFVDDETGKWRFTFIAKAEVFGEQTLETADPKRYTYVFGQGETTRTAESRFRQLATIPTKRLEDILETFSVEKVNREFFDQYKKHYEACWRLLAEPNSVAYAIFKINPTLADDKARKPLRDFAKRLMGRLVFLYFLQKKGWMGCPVEPTDWQDGDPDFTANLFRQLPAAEQAHFYSRQLTRLFFNTLNERRRGDLFAMPDGKQVRIPYLNGGLFDGDLPGTERLDFPAEWFAQLFAFFGQYNFTIDEGSPHDHEVGIDPEMLGHIFENLLEENREKGAYYTPKEIVHYMCQESLLLYLKNELLGYEEVTDHQTVTRFDNFQKVVKSVGSDVVWSDSRADDERELEHFVRHKERGPKGNFIHKNAQPIERALKNVRICDPAIGSGAFPMGLLYEIFHCQLELDLTEPYGELKKDIIHHCIYGVDKDKGAVDIARLRFWLTLVVDENVPQPLPNLDYKIMQGDSLLEAYEGIDLSNLLDNANQPPAAAPHLFDMVQEPAVQFGEKDKNKLSRWINSFFEPKSNAEKSDLQGKIDGLIHRELNETIRHYKVRLLLALEDQRKAFARETALKRPGTRQRKEIIRLDTEIARCEQQQVELADWQSRDERPYFLWHTWFREPLDRGGFHIVIGNPPYVQIQRLGRYADLLQAAGYQTFVRSGDLYCLFYEQALRLLRPAGVLAFITSNSWLKTIYGQPLRRYFAEHSTPVALLNFEDAQIFKAAIVETNILLALKGRYPLTARAVALGLDTDATIPLHEQLAEKGSPLQDFSEKEWIIGDAAAVRLKTMMEEGNKRLIEMEVKINYGIKTGLNEAFIINERTKDALLDADLKNAEIFKPILRGRDVQRYGYRYENLWLINAHNGIRNFGIKGIDVPNDYASIFKYLNQFQPQIASRSDQGDHWYNLRNCTYFLEFEKPKVIWGELSNLPKFTYDRHCFYIDVTLFFMTGERLKYFLAILNSKVGEWYFNQISTTSGMGTNRWKKYKIEQLPIPSATPAQELAVERLVEYMLWLYNSENPPVNAQATNLQVARYFDDVLNMAVYELYFSVELEIHDLNVFQWLTNERLPVLGEHDTDNAQIINTLFNWFIETGNPVRTRAQTANLICEPVRLINAAIK